ncbi:MAG: hypothetical protein PHG85_02375 [Candidatus Altiarchaeota archaeon]|nr:hypothetical protein [Candidatus Altiarchaeota archaeon]
MPDNVDSTTVVETDAKADASSRVVVGSKVDETPTVVEAKVGEDSVRVVETSSKVDDTANVVVGSKVDETTASVVETSASTVVETEAKDDETPSETETSGLMIEFIVDKIPEKTESKVDKPGSEDAVLDDVTTSSATTLTV